MFDLAAKIPTTVGVIDIGIANLGSIERTLSEIADEVVIINKVGLCDAVDRLVLPGVGAYPAAMELLRTSEMSAEIRAFAARPNRAVLGICLGMQLLSSTGEEHEVTEGLNLIPGHVRKLSSSGNERIPHVGWNSVHFTSEHPLFVNIADESDFYFVHSYVFDVLHQNARIAATRHGEVFSAAVCHENVVGVQFHPEKSSRAGRTLLRNFCEWTPC